MRILCTWIGVGFAFAAQAQTPDLKLMAMMDGASVVSATESKASGQALAMLSEDGKVTMDIAFTGLASAATSVELLLGKATENGVAIGPLNVGEGETGASKLGLTMTLTSEQEQAMRDGMTYVLVRTIDYPGGAIRGQLVPQAPVLLGTPIVPQTDDKTNNSTEPATDR
ncbi:MAG: CHRD domain-containing protein [Lysobacterales bacterium]